MTGAPRSLSPSRIADARRPSKRAVAQQLGFLLLIIIATCYRAETQQAGSAASPVVHLVTVEKGVQLEVLDWGGTGRPLILLQGLGGVAHDYDKLASQFTARNHVYAITRRGFGDSGKPAPTVANYSAERLGKDVLIVMQSLKLNRPVVAGQSIAGEELSWVGTYHPDAVAGLIYLDAVDSYSFYDPAQSDMVMDMVEVRREINAFQASEPLSAAVLGQIRDSAEALSKSAGSMAHNVSFGRGDPAPPPVGLAIRFGAEKFTTVQAPMLAIMACPHDYSQLAQENPKAATDLKARDMARCTEQIHFLKANNPSAKVVVLANADHQMLRTNEADVVRAMHNFLATLQ